MTDKEKTIKELKEVLDNLNITNKYRLNIIRAIEYLQEKPVIEDILDMSRIDYRLQHESIQDGIKYHAEELAERAYPKREYVIYGPLPSEEPSVIDDNKPYRIGFVEGYHQAEKDLELTWEDIKLIIDIVDSENLKPHLFDEIDYQEVLKRFKLKKI